MIMVMFILLEIIAQLLEFLCYHARISASKDVGDWLVNRIPTG